MATATKLSKENYLFIKAIIANNGDCYIASDNYWGANRCLGCPINKKLTGKACTVYFARQAAIELLNEEVRKLIES